MIGLNTDSFGSLTEIIIPLSKINLEYNYPLCKPIRFEHECDGGFSRIHLITIIINDYTKIYNEGCYIVVNLDEPYKHEFSNLIIKGINKYNDNIYKVVVES